MPLKSVRAHQGLRGTYQHPPFPRRDLTDQQSKAIQSDSAKVWRSEVDRMSFSRILNHPTQYPLQQERQKPILSPRQAPGQLPPQPTPRQWPRPCRTTTEKYVRLGPPARPAVGSTRTSPGGKRLRQCSKTTKLEAFPVVCRMPWMPRSPFGLPLFIPPVPLPPCASAQSYACASGQPATQLCALPLCYPPASLCRHDVTPPHQRTHTPRDPFCKKKLRPTISRGVSQSLG